MADAKKILVIDDDPTIVNQLEALLQSKGFDVIRAPGAIEGIRLAQDRKPDLILLDVMMPAMTGYQVCALLKGDAASRNIPVIMLTARAREEDRETGQKVGVNVYLKKPINADAVIAAITAQLGIEEIPLGVGDVEENFEAKMQKMKDEYLAVLPLKIKDIKNKWSSLQQNSPSDAKNFGEMSEKFKELKRMVHNIAGTAGSFDLEALGQVAHTFDMALSWPLADEHFAVGGNIDRLVMDLEQAAKL